FNYVQNGNPLRLRTSISWRVSGCTANYDLFYPNRVFTGDAYFNGELYSAGDADGRSPSSLIANALPCTVPYNLVVLLEGFYVGSGSMSTALSNAGVSAGANDVDTIVAELRSTTDPSIIVSSLSGIVDVTGNATFIFPSSVAGNSYWLVVKHRNSVEAWSAAPVTMSINGTYDFTSSASQTYLSNIANVGSGDYALFTGDINQDGFVDAYDYTLYEDQSISFSTGYLGSDLNGDGFVDAFDFPLFESNQLNFVMAVTP
ncbi:MAG: hypothetical protein RL021_971, partial [Bacteroidota bacterium]